MRSFTIAIAVLISLLIAGAVPADAQTPDAAAVRQEIAALRAQLDALQGRLTTLEAQLPGGAGTAAPAAAPVAPSADPASQQTAEVPPGAAGAGGPSGALPLYGAGAASSKVFNPDIAVIGDFLAAAGRNRKNPSPAFEMHEAEASFQAVVDPYARADFFIAFGQEGVELEEGFITFPTLPGGLLVKAGKMRAAFGKVNTLHNHMVTWTDRPLAINNLLNGEEGIGDAGVSVARLVPNRWLFLEATGQVFRGESGDLFHATKRSDLTYVAHLRGYQDITENANIDVGASYARGHNAAGLVNDVDAGRFQTAIWGADATMRWRPLQRAIYRSFLGRAEVLWSKREQFGGAQRSYGYYASGDYQFGRRWFAGVRYDNSARADDASLRDTGQSVLLTYWPSEFSQLRGQYRRIKYGDADTANELLFQLQFSIGAHGAHPF